MAASFQMRRISNRAIPVVAEHEGVTSNQKKGSNLVSVFAVLLSIGATVSAVIGEISNSSAVLALVPFRVYVAILLCGVAFGVIGILLRRCSGSAYLRAFAMALAFSCSLLWIAQVVPALYQALRQTEPEPAPSVLPSQSSPLVVENGSLEHEDYNQQNLSHSRLSHTRVVDVDFGDTNLSESDFRGATFVRVNLAGANLCAVDLRGADLTKAGNLNDVKNWNFAYYDASTKLPQSLDINLVQGPQEAVPGGLLYSCTPNQTRQLLDDGTRR